MKHWNHRAVACSAVTWLLIAAAVEAPAGEPGPVGAPEEGGGTSRSMDNSLGQPIVYTDHLSLTRRPGDVTWAAGYDTNRVSTNGVSVAAQSGDAEAQVSLAVWLHDGRHGFPTNTIQAYKWAVIAASQNQSAHAQYAARHLLDEWRPAMSTNDVAAGEAAAAAARSARDKKKQQ
jgi:TPR repeat protein